MRALFLFRWRLPGFFFFPLAHNLFHAFVGVGLLTRPCSRCSRTRSFPLAAFFASRASRTRSSLSLSLFLSRETQESALLFSLRGPEFSPPLRHAPARASLQAPLLRHTAALAGHRGEIACADDDDEGFGVCKREREREEERRRQEEENRKPDGRRRRQPLDLESSPLPRPRLQILIVPYGSGDDILLALSI